MNDILTIIGNSLIQQLEVNIAINTSNGCIHTISKTLVNNRIIGRY